MDRIAEVIAKHGNVWSLTTNSDMIEVFEPLQAEMAASFKDTVKSVKAQKYGPDERQRADIYYPASGLVSPTASLPVVVFFHGGGFVGGDNDISPSIFGNIGNYFASKGCVCVLATYRFVFQSALYPSGAEDVTLAVQWAESHAPKYGGDITKITAIGQSSGGAHVASALYSGALKKSGVKLQGAVLLSAPLWYDLRQERRKQTMLKYHNTESEEDVLAKTAVAVFRDAPEHDIMPCEVLIMLADLDTNEQIDGNLMFIEEHRKRYSRLPLVEVMKGHNHVSYVLGLGLGTDVVGPRLLEFITKGEK